MYHNPVLLESSISHLIASTSGTYVDVTYGGGGHSRLLLSRLDAQARLLAFDQDPDASLNQIDDPRFQFIPYNFRHLKKFLQFYKSYPVDGIIADLGVSSYQFDTPERGFSHRFDNELDMRMDNRKGISASDIVNGYSPQQLANVLQQYGEVMQASRIAHCIVQSREIQPIHTTGALVDAVKSLLPKGKENKVLSQIFQALRIEVNQEIEVLKDFLSQTVDALKPNGRIVVISYHSLEDRLVKNFFKTGNFEGVMKKDFFGNPLTPFALVTRKALIPTDEEIAVNPRARSAKLRVAQKKDDK